MIGRSKIFSVIFIFILLANTFFCFTVEGCKDIIAVGEATDGNYNLLLKVRDPSRPGLQVLCIVPDGAEYTYHHPWTGKPIEFESFHKYIGVATKGDTLPNIVKAGMSLSDVGIAYGDADTGSNWKNPTRNAWDDFDWIRYACEKADDEDEAVKLLTKDCVDKLHASAVSENLFIVGPEKAFVIEADAFRYNVKEIKNIVAMTNYPKKLWRTQLIKTLPIASSFNTEKEKYVKKGRTVRLNSLYGVRIVDVEDDWIIARQVPFIKIYNRWIRIVGKRVKIQIGERKTVGDYSIKLLDIDGRKAKISITTVFKAWEDEILKHIKSRYGSIDIKDMIKWSRLHEEDVDDLRPMCEDYFSYEAVIIYKIPSKKYVDLSSGWFSANHACSSIYVPFHIVDSEIYKPYKTGEAAEISIKLLDIYGHGTLSSIFNKVEDVFLNETKEYEKIAITYIEKNTDITDFMTKADISMQKQAWLTEQIWLEIGKKSNSKTKQDTTNIISEIWNSNYTASLISISNSINEINSMLDTETTDRIIEIALNICKSRLEVAKIVGKNTTEFFNMYENGKKLIERGSYETGFQLIIKAFNGGDLLLKNRELLDIPDVNPKDDIKEMSLILVSLFFLLGILFYVVVKKRI